MPENIPDRKVDVICLYRDKARLEARSLLMNTKESLTTSSRSLSCSSIRLISIILLLMVLLLVGNYNSRAGGVWSIMTMSATPSYLTRIQYYRDGKGKWWVYCPHVSQSCLSATSTDRSYKKQNIIARQDWLVKWGFSPLLYRLQTFLSFNLTFKVSWSVTILII